MEKERNIRWEQRFSNYKDALKKFNEAVDYITGYRAKRETDNDNKGEVFEEILKEGLIQRFEYTYELAWNVMKDYALYQGNTAISGSRDAIRYAFSSNLVSNGEMWMNMIKSRIKTTHLYDEKTIEEVFEKIIKDYHPLFLDFKRVMEQKIAEK